MLPAESLRAGAVMVSHEFSPSPQVGGDFLDYFVLTDGRSALYREDVSGRDFRPHCTRVDVGTLRGVHKTGTSPTMCSGL